MRYGRGWADAVVRPDGMVDERSGDSHRRERKPSAVGADSTAQPIPVQPRLGARARVQVAPRSSRHVHPAGAAWIEWAYLPQPRARLTYDSPWADSLTRMARSAYGTLDASSDLTPKREPLIVDNKLKPANCPPMSLMVGAWRASTVLRTSQLRLREASPSIECFR